MQTVLAWLDFDCYSYINFGIINSMVRANKYEFVGVVATKPDYEFFKNQNLVPFKEILYYPDCYKGKISYDAAHMDLLVRQYGLDIWQLAYTERSFYKYWTDFHKFTKDEILSIIYYTAKYFLYLFEAHRPQLILMQQAGENISNLILYRLAKKTGIKIIMPNQVYLRNRIIMSDNLLSLEIPELFKNSHHHTTDMICDPGFIKSQDRSESVETILHGTRKNTLQSVRHHISTFTEAYDPTYLNSGKTKSSMAIHRIKSHMETRKRKQFLEGNSIKEINNVKFLYYPLVTEPEARILATTPYLSDQIAVIENIAKSIPHDHLLYVKEHPLQQTKLWRPIPFYQTILEMPNVRLIHYMVKNSEIIPKSQGVIAISGGTPFEAIFYKKPVILLGDEYYDCLGMVRKARSFSELPEAIRKALAEYEFNGMELDRFMGAFGKATIPIPYHDIINDGSALSTTQRYGRNHTRTEYQFIQFYRKYHTCFEGMSHSIESRLQPKVQENLTQ